jgi:hypothetical protein
MSIFLTNKRGSSWGLFVAPPGIDATTASISDLLLNITDNVPQLIMAGSATNGQNIALSLTYVPVVLITNVEVINSLPSGSARPWGNVSQGSTGSHVNVSTTNISVSTGFGSLGYLVFRAPA